MSQLYDPKHIEPKWQAAWKESKIFRAPEKTSREKKMYVLPQLPYPSGSGLHVGHAEVYTACDMYARYMRMQGKDVLQVIGWDAFGLPAENYAIKTNIHPRVSTDTAIQNFRTQIQSLGISVDWEREVGSHNPDYYKWTQWFFQLFYKRGLAYRKKQAVNWCDSCKTVLANEQVTTDGTCERCSTVIVQRDMEQWYLKITEYADRLDKDLDKIDWPEETKRRQKNWIGKSEGAEIQFSLKDHAGVLTVFTTRPETIFGVTYVVVAPEHSFLETYRDQIHNFAEVEEYRQKTSLKTELERQTEKVKTGVELKGLHVIHPITKEVLPVWTADYVLNTYGTGAVMAVPAHDERDASFAQMYSLPIRTIIADGALVDSDFLSGRTEEQAKTDILAYLEKNAIGERKTKYKIRDWSVSRQRFWGAPVPMVYDPEGNIHPAKESDLPVLLPDDVDFKPTGQSPLTYSQTFQADVEEKYGKGWRREVDTLDTFMCSSWYYYRYLDPKNDTAFASPEALKSWMPVDFYLGGEEHVNGHLLYSRFFTKVLFDAGYIDFDEPFTVHRHQGLILGEDSRKMSKRWGNVVNPTDVVNEYGADTLRMYEMFMGPLEQTKPWDTNGVKGVRRFLDKIWKLLSGESAAQTHSEVEKALHATIKKITEDIPQLRFNTSVAQLMIFGNTLQEHQAISKEDKALFVKVLAPFAPHIAEELWHLLGETSFVSTETWPTYDPKKLVSDTMTIAIQVNGKLRANIEMNSDASEEEIRAMALADENVKRWVTSEPKKVIYVKGKLVSIVV